MVAVCRMAPQAALLEQSLAVGHRHPAGRTTRARRARRAIPRRLFCFGSLVILEVARCYLWLFTLYVNIKIGINSC